MLEEVLPVAGLALAGVSLRMLAAFSPPMDGPFDRIVDMDSMVLLFTAVGLVGRRADLRDAGAPARESRHQLRGQG